MNSSAPRAHSLCPHCSLQHLGTRYNVAQKQEEQAPAIYQNNLCHAGLPFHRACFALRARWHPTIFILGKHKRQLHTRQRTTISCLEGEETFPSPRDPVTAAVTFSLLSLGFQKFWPPRQFYNPCSALWCFFSTAGQETRKTMQKGFCRAFQNAYKQHNHPSISELLAWNTVTFSKRNWGAWCFQHIHLKFILYYYMNLLTT